MQQQRCASRKNYVENVFFTHANRSVIENFYRTVFVNSFVHFVRCTVVSDRVQFIVSYFIFTRKLHTIDIVYSRICTSPFANVFSFDFAQFKKKTISRANLGFSRRERTLFVYTYTIFRRRINGRSIRENLRLGKIHHTASYRVVHAKDRGLPNIFVKRIFTTWRTRNQILSTPSAHARRRMRFFDLLRARGGASVVTYGFLQFRRDCCYTITRVSLQRFFFLQQVPSIQTSK